MRSKSQALTMDEVRARFEAWRQNRQGKSPIPDELWSAAAELARKDGINRTAAELHLDGGKLKVVFAYYSEASSKLETVTCMGSLTEIEEQVRQRQLPARVQELVDVAIKQLRK